MQRLPFFRCVEILEATQIKNADRVVYYIGLPLSSKGTYRTAVKKWVNLYRSAVKQARRESKSLPLGSKDTYRSAVSQINCVASTAPGIAPITHRNPRKTTHFSARFGLNKGLKWRYIGVKHVLSPPKRPENGEKVRQKLHIKWHTKMHLKPLMHKDLSAP